MIQLIFKLKHEMEFDPEVLKHFASKDEFCDKIERLVEIEYRTFKTRVDNGIINYLKTLNND